MGKDFKPKVGTYNVDKEEILYHEGVDALAQVAQRSCCCPLTGSVQGQVGWGFEHPGLVKEVPTHDRVLELDDL